MIIIGRNKIINGKTDSIIARKIRISYKYANIPIIPLKYDTDTNLSIFTVEYPILLLMRYINIHEIPISKTNVINILGKVGLISNRFDGIE
jgi:hypothetical protein